MRRGAAASSHNASSTNSPRAASTSATAAPAIIHSSGQTILENNNNLNNNNNNAFENNIRPATPVASSSSSSSSQYQTKMMNTSGGGNIGSNRVFRQSTASSTSHSSSSNSSTLHLSEQQISIKFGSVACLLSFCLILFGSGLVRESKLKRHEIPGDLHTRVFVEKMNKWNNIYRDEFERVEWMLIDNNFNDAQASPNIETLRSTTEATNYQAPKLATPQTYEALKFQSSNLMETYVLPKIYPKYAEYMPSIDTLREAVKKGNPMPATKTLLNKTSVKNNLNDAMNNTALVSRMLEMPLSLSLVGKDTASNQIVASIDLGEQILFQKTILSHVNNKICKYQMGGYHTNTQNCETYSALLRVCFKVRKSGVEENARWVLDDTFGNFGCEPGSLTRVRGISSGSSSDSSSSSSSSSSSNSKSGDSNTGITNTAVNGNSDNGSLLWKPSIRKRIDAPQIKATLPDANKIRVAFAEQTVTIQHAFDPEIWLKNQTIFKRNYERHRAKVSIEGIVLIVVGSALGIPGVGLLLLGFIKRKRTVRSRRGYVQLQFPGPDYV